MERTIDFSRKRDMLCDRRGLTWLVDLEWIDTWEQALERCPGCGVTCEAEDAARVTVDSKDAALRDLDVPDLAWYHTTTQPDWPTPSFDLGARLTPETRLRMGGDRHVEGWVERQRSRALHVGTMRQLFTMRSAASRTIADTYRAQRSGPKRRVAATGLWRVGGPTQRTGLSPPVARASSGLERT